MPAPRSLVASRRADHIANSCPAPIDARRDGCIWADTVGVCQVCQVRRFVDSRFSWYSCGGFILGRQAIHHTQGSARVASRIQMVWRLAGTAEGLLAEGGELLINHSRRPRLFSGMIWRPVATLRVRTHGLSIEPLAAQTTSSRSHNS